jgi:trehalose-phosphatase
MKDLLEYWPSVARAITRKQAVIFLDYDGTLTPIVDKPGRAVLPPATRSILKKLAKNPHCTLAIVSGRSLADVKRRVRINGIVYAGNHGFEVDYHGIHLVFSNNEEFSQRLKVLERYLREKTKGIKGVLIENKGISLSVHYRLAAKRKIHVVKEIFTTMVRPYVRGKLLSVSTGKMVLEIRPPVQWGKGDLVRWMLPDSSHKKQAGAVFYFGDDTTDEDAFKMLKGKGYTVLVGAKKISGAEYYLRNSGEVREILHKIRHELEATR